ncbi:MAG: chemotaxis protein CheX [Oscillospiraceae bacterium]|nr:chemotaxis protein CheX [Oscillospiraceae bacterium]
MDIANELGQIYSDALSEVVYTVSGIKLQVDCRESNKDFDEVIGVMYLQGNKTGMLFVTANEPDVKILCSHMIGTPVAEIEADEIDDTMCELVNMTAGSAKLRLSNTDYMFSLLQPFVIKGKDVSIVTKRITKVESGTLSDGNISIRFKVVY